MYIMYVGSYVMDHMQQGGGEQSEPTCLWYAVPIANSTIVLTHLLFKHSIDAHKAASRV